MLGPVSTSTISLSGNLSFGNVTVGSLATATMTISNTGNSAITESGITYPSGFTGAWNGSIPAGGTQNVTVTFRPTAVQSYNGTITVSSDAISGTGTIAVSGMGQVALSDLAGYYNGLVGTGDVGAGSAADMQAFSAKNGFVLITLAADGTLGGSLRLEGRSYPFSGFLGADRTASVTVTRPGKSNAVLALSLDSNLPGTISGTVDTGSGPVGLSAPRGGYTGAASTHALGGRRYTILLPAPAGLSLGHGYATLAVNPDGSAVLSGKLATGNDFTAGARIVDDGNGNWVFPAYVGSTGVLVGEIVIAKAPAAGSAEVSGGLAWLRPTNPSAALYPSGFLSEILPVGREFVPPVSTSALSGTTSAAAFTLAVDPAHAVLPAAISQGGSWPATNIPLLAAPVPAGLTLKFTPSTGQFAGTVNRTVNGAAVPTAYQGVIFGGNINNLRGTGFLTNGEASVPVQITSP